VMFFGVFTGIFSSMYIAPSMLMLIRRRWPLAGQAPRSVRAARPAARSNAPAAR
jgi:preprotein translocase subunit SecF